MMPTRYSTNARLETAGRPAQKRHAPGGGSRGVRVDQRSKHHFVFITKTPFQSGGGGAILYRPARSE